TCSAGFIGYHLSKALSDKGFEIYGIDSLNPYYDVNLKKNRLKECGIQVDTYGEEYQSDRYPNYRFCQIDLCDKKALEKIFSTHTFDCIVNLAAQAGVRYSLTHPETYVESNIAGFLNLLESCRQYACPRLIYASSSSVYGNSNEVPFKESARTDTPVSIYAATKKANELMAYSYSQLYKLQTIGLRFFTVYGPYGRPDMAPMLFANAIKNDEPIRVFNNGQLSRDFTYIDDIVEGIFKIISRPGLVREDHPGIPAVVYNIGHGSPIPLLDFIEILERQLGKTAHKKYVGMQAGDVYQTWADTTKLKEDYDYTPATPLETGIKHFIDWFKS
ncbi:MAG: NAD-dependent epimerase/dehydratase family protein, partial [Odoribacter sp.]